jgi:hypothetical protein
MWAKSAKTSCKVCLPDFSSRIAFSLAFAKVLQVVARDQRLIQRGEFVHIDKEVVMPGIRG